MLGSPAKGPGGCPVAAGRLLRRQPTRALGGRAGPLYAGRMFNVSGRTLTVIAVLAFVLLVLGLTTDLGLFGWVLALILGAYVVAAFVMGRRAT